MRYRFVVAWNASWHGGGVVSQVCGGPHEGKIIRLTSGGAEVRVGRSVSKANGLRLDKDMEVSGK